MSNINDTKDVEAVAEGLSVVRTRCLVILTLIAVTVAFYFGREFFVPIVFAILVSALFRPLVRAGKRGGVPATLTSSVIVLGLFAAIGIAGFVLAAPMQHWADTLPDRIEQAQKRLERFRPQIEHFQDVAKKVQDATTGPTTQQSTPAAEPANAGLLKGAFGTASKLLSAVVEVLLLLFLILAADDLFTKKLVRVMPTRRDKAEASQTVEEAESVIKGFVLVTALINGVQATIVGLTLWALGMPNPLLWAIATFVLEFIPYLGATVMVGLLTITSLASFDSLAHILAVPGAYLVITTIQNNVASPILYGRRLKLNAVAVLLAVLFWWFVWGIPGAFMAVPIVATLKIVADRSEHFEAIGEFLGE